MNTSEKSETGLKRLRTLSKSKAFGFIIVAIVAFSLGLLLSGGGNGTAEPDTHVDGESGSKEPTRWTCSMHPQIILPKAGQCPICLMDLIPLESDGGEELDPRQIKMTETAKQLARIATVPVTRAFAEAEIRMVGKLAYDETEVAYITAWAPGRLDRLYADFTGIRVSKGDPLVYVYSPELLAAQEELVQANAAVSALSDTKSTVLSTTAAATVDAAREKLRLYGVAEEQIQDIESTGKITDHLTIYSPIGGVVVHKNAKEGMYVKIGTRIYTIADLSKLWVLLEAHESDLPWLRYGQRVEFSSQSFPGETFRAVISFIDPVVDSRKRTVRVRAIVDNSSQRLKPD
ncbi:MAG: efflux RND transporter periplasmic adaptor subunit, partial [candidate division Zixibacteria bacterium]|nr:efflux RND transporter periplasmic adaptor subunit [candidate division Zixibacteria bacterium]